MNNNKACLIAPWRITGIKTQGYNKGFTEEEISQHSIGNRFAYQMCTLLFLTGIILTNIPILIVASTVAFLAVVLPYHPFDYLYNAVIRHWFGRPRLPRRTNQAKFACGIASVWILAIIYLIYADLLIGAYLLGGILLIVALLVSVMDFCIPSMVYNMLFARRKPVDQNFGN